MALDSMDRKILSVLQEDGRASNTSIAKRFAVSESTVRKRIERLRKEGFVQIVGVTDPTKMGLPFAVMIFFRVETKYIPEVAKQLAEMREANFVAICTGSADIIASGFFKSEKRLLDFVTGRIAKIKGLISTETHLMLKIEKRVFNWQILEADT